MGYSQEVRFRVILLVMKALLLTVLVSGVLILAVLGLMGIFEYIDMTEMRDYMLKTVMALGVLFLAGLVILGILNAMKKN